MDYLIPDWPAPANVQALSTYRYPGFSHNHYASNNFALHVGDDPSQVMLNREQLSEHLRLLSPPEWLEQTHSTDCVIIEETANRRADASITRLPNRILAILTADCLPIILCNRQGNEVAAIHAGWRGLVNGVIENTLQKMQSQRTDLLAWIGPAICQACYETGAEVYTTFLEQYPKSGQYFKPIGTKFLADLPGLASHVLNTAGIEQVFPSNKCTFERKNEFYSYRRSAQTGRIATLIGFK